MRSTLRPVRMDWPMRVALPALIGLLALLACMALSSEALAAKGVVGVFGGSGTASGQFGSSSPRGVAITQSNGDVYVVDGGNHRVQRFSASGAYLSQLGTGVSGSGNTQFNSPQGVAVDQLDGSVWVSDGGNFRAIKFNVLGSFVAKTAFSTSGVADGQFASTFNGHLAVDPSGNVFVADPGGATSRRVQKFNSSGVYQAKFGSQGAAAGQFGASPVSPSRVAIDGTGAIYVVDQGNARIQKCLSLGGAPETFSCTVFATYSATGTITLPHAVAVDRSNNRVLVARRNGTATGEVVVDEFDSTGVLLDTHGVGAGIGNAVSASTMNTTSALAIRESTGTIYLTISDATRRVFMLNTVTAPTATIGAVTGIGSHTATVSGQVNPNGSPTGYHFEYRKVGAAAWTSFPTTDAEAGAGSANVSVSQNLVGLQSDADYEVRLVATKPFNAGAVTSSVQAFATAPAPAEVATLAPDNILVGGARLRGTVNPNNATTSYRFEYGPDTSYGSTTAGTQIGGGDVGTVSKQVTGLAPDTIYHYRLVATNERGAVYGDDVEFRTAAAPQAPEGRGYEMVTPPHKPNRRGVVYATFSAAGAGAGAIPAPAGDRVLVGVSTGVLSDADFSFLNDYVLFDRTDDSWEGTPVFKDVKAYSAPTGTTIQGNALTDDLMTSAWSSSSALRPEDAEVSKQVAGDATGGVILPYHRSAEGVWQGRLSSVSQVSVGPLPVGSLGTGALFSKDGSYQTFWGMFHGLLGPTVEQDPSNSQLFNLFGGSAPKAGRAIYGVDVATGSMALINGCTGSGASSTSIPSIEGGKQATQACPSGNVTNVRGAVAGAGPELTVADSLSNDGETTFFTSPDPVVAPTSCSGTGATTSCPPQLYVRTAGSGDPAVRWISKSAVANQDATLWGRGALYEGAADDGSKMFFKSNAPLTGDDPNATAAAPVTTGAASPNSWDLYQYEMPDDSEDPSAGSLTRVSAGPTPRATGTGTLTSGSPTVTSKVTDTGTFAVGQAISGSGIPAGTTITAVDSSTLTLSQNASSPGSNVALSAASDPNVICSAMSAGSCSGFEGASARYISDDGSKVYFVTNSPIPGVPAPTDGTSTTPGGTAVNTTIRNLYLYDSSKPFSERWTFIARVPLPSSLSAAGGSVAACAAFGGVPITLFGSSPNSGLSGTNGANCLSGTPSGDRIAFLTNGRLTADDTDDAFDVYTYSAASASEGDSLERVSAPAPDAPTGEPYRCLDGPAQLMCNAGTGRQPVGLIASGPFTSTGYSHFNLTTNGDVIFDSQRPLVGADKNLSFDVYRWNEGVLSLVSPGSATSDHAVFAGASLDGRDIFFNTSQPIDPREVDAGDYDIYDARLGGGYADPPVEPDPCDSLADRCQEDGRGSERGEIATGATGSGDDPLQGTRQRVRVLSPGRQERLLAALTGTLSLRLNVAAPGTVTVKALTRGRKRPRRTVVVGRKRARVERPGLVKVGLRLDKRARRQLASRKPLRLRVVVDATGGRSTGLAMTLRRPGATGGKR